MAKTKPEAEDTSTETTTSAPAPTSAHHIDERGNVVRSATQKKLLAALADSMTSTKIDRTERGDESGRELARRVRKPPVFLAREVELQQKAIDLDKKIAAEEEEKKKRPPKVETPPPAALPSTAVNAKPRAPAQVTPAVATTPPPRRTATTTTVAVARSSATTAVNPRPPKVDTMPSPPLSSKKVTPSPPAPAPSPKKGGRR